MRMNLKQIAEKTAGFSGVDMQGLDLFKGCSCLPNDELQAVKGEKHNAKDKTSFLTFSKSIQRN